MVHSLDFNTCNHIISEDGKRDNKMITQEQKGYKIRRSAKARIKKDCKQQLNTFLFDKMPGVNKTNIIIPSIQDEVDSHNLHSNYEKILRLPHKKLFRSRLCHYQESGAFPIKPIQLASTINNDYKPSTYNSLRKGCSPFLIKPILPTRNRRKCTNGPIKQIIPMNVESQPISLQLEHVVYSPNGFCQS